MQQIAANKVLIKYIQDGYKIARNGLTAIGQITNHEFNLHDVFFESLNIVDPRIKRLSKLADVIRLQETTLKFINRSHDTIKACKDFTTSEQKYIARVFKRLLNQTAFNTEELLKTVTSYAYTLSDDQRIRKIDLIHLDQKSIYLVARNFSSGANLLSVQRTKEKDAVDFSRSINGIK
jgi:hypothetical protein